jgi:putative colanic acid biosynthesis acetyltransferase WcaF
MGVCLILCSWTPKPANFWRLFWLKVFGAKIFGRPFVHQRARIQIPWNLIMHDRSCLGDRSNAYSLGIIEIKEHATVAQEAYLCTGTHAFDNPARNLITSPIIIGAHAFIGARAFIMPGINIGEYAIVGACSVVTKDVGAHGVVKGNPAK